MPSPRVLDQRGVALPMALMTLTLLTSLMLALASLSQTEPVIAVNHLRSSQARALAESGIEHALWALAHPSDPAGLPLPLPAGGAPPFDGQTFLALGPGGFTVKVTNHADGDPNHGTIESTGWVPTSSATDMRPRARRTVVVDVAAVPRLGRPAPCALCVRGALDLAGDVLIDGRNADPACGADAKYGAFSQDATTLTGPVSLLGGAGPGVQQQATAAFDALTLSPAALEAIKTLAWRNGTYYGPGFPRGGTVSDGQSTWSGRIAFDAATPLPDGVVFVDTTDGGALAASATTTAAEVRLDPGAVTAADGTFRGWIVVNGALAISGPPSIRGLVYAMDTLTYRATGAGRLDGLAVALNVRGIAPSRVEAVAGASVALAFDCAAAAGVGSVPRGFLLVPGTYREE